jgi:hypothetical protein
VHGSPTRLAESKQYPYNQLARHVRSAQGNFMNKEMVKTRSMFSRTLEALSIVAFLVFLLVILLLGMQGKM